VEVVDQHHRWLARAARPRHPAGEGDELALAGLGVEARRRALRIGHVEEVKDQWQCLAQPVVEQHQRAGDLAPRLGGRIALVDAEVAAEELQDGVERQRAAVRQAVPLVDRDRLRARPPEQLEAEAALAHPRFPDHPDDVLLADERALEGGIERRHLPLAPNEACEAAAPGHLQARAGGPAALQLEDPDRLRRTLEAHFTQIAQREVRGDEPRGVLGERDAVRGGHLLHALGEPHHVALCRVLHAQIIADRADHDLGRVEAHANREVHSLLEAQLVGVAAQLLAEMQRRPAGALGVILVGDRRAEQRHDAVAGELVDETLEALDAGGEEVEKAVHDLRPLLRPDLLGQLHAPLHVGEEHGDRLALALEGGAAREDPVGQMPGRIRVRLGCGDGGSGRQRRCALWTELRRRGRLGAARGAAARDWTGAFDAELRRGRVFVLAPGTLHLASRLDDRSGGPCLIDSATYLSTPPTANWPRFATRRR
jgi:hypothetical protein